MPKSPKISQRTFSRRADGAKLNRALRSNLRSLTADINAQPKAIGMQDGKVPSGFRQDDIGHRVSASTLTFTKLDADGNAIDFPISQAVTQYVGKLTVTAAPTVTELPNDGDYGWAINGTTVYWAINDNGTIRFPTLSTLSGNITDAQHGDRSTTTTTMHKFLQISGTITAAQHGSLTNNATASHSNATTSQAGFMSTAHFDLVDGATTAATPNTLVIRGSGGGGIFTGTLAGVIADMSTEYRVSGTKVVETRKTGYTAMTGTKNRGSSYATGTITLVQLAERVGALQDDLASHGLIGT